MEHLAGENSIRRAPSVYSVAAAWFSAPIYSAPVGDALTTQPQISSHNHPEM
jgi:hypothetical protein